MAWLILLWNAFGPTIGPLPRTATDGATIVFIGVDRSFSWRSPGRPEPLWPLGAWVWRALDRRVIAVHGRDFQAQCARAADEVKRRGFDRIGRLEIWSHGGPGWFRIQRTRHYATTFVEESRGHAPGLDRLRELLVEDALVAFRTCSTFHGRSGRQFAEFASKYFNGRSPGRARNPSVGRRVTVLGHTRPIAVIQPGCVTLRSGSRAGWSVSDGRSEQSLRDLAIFNRDVMWVMSGGLYELWRMWQDEAESPGTTRKLRRGA